MKIMIPADVPQSMHDTYRENYEAITFGTGRLMLFACDQKLEHLNDDFFGPEIHPDANNPEHMFMIASHGKVGALATHPGLLARYGAKYKNVNYCVKINGKTNLVHADQRDPMTASLMSVDDLIRFKKESGLNITSVGCTVYLGSEYETQMLEQASRMIFQAHQHGLIAIVWMYPRGKAIKNDEDYQLTAGATGMAAVLGADFVKIKPPMISDEKTSAQLLAIATEAAGNTKVICSGGSRKGVDQLLNELHDQITIGNTQGSATGRNIFQRSLREAVALTHAIAAIVLDKKTVDEALMIYTYNVKQ